MGRLGRIDWRTALVGVIASFILGMALPPEFGTRPYLWFASGWSFLRAAGTARRIEPPASAGPAATPRRVLASGESRVLEGPGFRRLLVVNEPPLATAVNVACHSDDARLVVGGHGQVLCHERDC